MPAQPDDSAAVHAGDPIIAPENMSSLCSDTDSSMYNELTPLFQRTRHDLRSKQIIFIVISGTIGIGLFTNTGEILRIAGPGGGLIAFVVVSVWVATVMDGISQMINRWPISNAWVEFVSAFVDQELGLLVGFAYWCANSIIFASLIGTASDLMEYWTADLLLQILTIFLAWSITIAINLRGVKVWGWIETIAGGLKLVFVIGTLLLMLLLNGGAFSNPKIGAKNISDGFCNDLEVASNPITAVLIAIPIATYCFCGVEMFAVCASEAREPHKSLKTPSQYIAAIISGLYFFSSLSYYLDVSWRDPLLPSGEISRSGSTDISIIMIAALNSRISMLPGVFNACIFAAVISAANTALYVSARTLFGLTSIVDSQSPRFYVRILSKLSETKRDTKVPVRALIWSALAFCWLPFIHLGPNGDDRRVEQIMNGIATDAIILVWAAQCYAFICFERYSSYSKNYWAPNPDSEPLENNTFNSNGILSYLQPLTAWVGMAMCLLIVLVFNTASWWGRGISGSEIIAAYTGPGLIGIIWILQKKASGKPWGVTIENYGDWEDAINSLDRKVQGRLRLEEGYDPISNLIVQRSKRLSNERHN